MSDDRLNQGGPLDDEISFVEFLRSVKYYIHILRRNWLSLIISLVIGLTCVVIYTIKEDPAYKAELSFMLSDDGSNQISGFNTILSQLGVPVSSGKYNIDKLLEISRSRSIIQKVLFENVNINDRNDLIANHFIDIYSLNNLWGKKDSSLSNFKYTKSQPDNFTPQENLVLLRLYRMLIGIAGEQNSGLIETDYGRDHYIMYFKVTTKSEELSINVATILFDKVKDYYLEKTIEKQLSTFHIIQSKRDSIQQRLTTVDYELALIKDKTIGKFRNQSTLKESSLATQSLLLKTALAKAEENLALAQFALENKTPLVQLIDAPLSPINAGQPNWLFRTMFGIVCGILLFVLFHLGKFLSE